MMDYKISNKQFILPALKADESINDRSFKLHHKIVHIFFSIIHCICPSFYKSVKVRLNKHEVIYVDIKSYESWRRSANFKVMAKLAKPFKLEFENSQDIVTQIRTVLKFFKVKKSTKIEFQNPVAKNIAQAITQGDDQKLKQIFNETLPKDLSEALKVQDAKKGSDLLRFAAQHNNLQAIDLIHSMLDEKFNNPQFPNPVANDIAKAIVLQDDQKLKQIFDETPPQNLAEALKVQDTNKGVNLLGFAAHRNHLQALDFIYSVADEDVLKEIIVQKDNHEWTAFHHLALVKDEGVRYKKFKKKTNINTKQISEHFFESPSMLRKYIRPDAGKFSTVSKKKPVHLYFRDGQPQQKEEQHLLFEKFMEKQGHQFSRPPESFKSIPQVKVEIFQTLWAEMQEPIVRDEMNATKLDQHLQAIANRGEEDGVALTPILHNDRGERLPEEIKVGLGIEARRDFAFNDLVTLYGGEYFTEKYPTDAPTSDYAFGSENKETIDGLKTRSYGSSIIHSAPNVKFEQINSILGITFVAMKATHAIKQNSQVCLNYGPNYFKSRNILPLETRPEGRHQMQVNPSENPAVRGMEEAYLNIEARVE